MPRFIAQYDDGTTYEGDLLDGSFSEIDHGKLVAFTTLYEGIVLGIDFRNGMFNINGEQHLRPLPPNPRLIAYATMRGNVQREWLYALVVGWQSTILLDGQLRNIRLGIRAVPVENRWELVEAI